MTADRALTPPKRTLVTGAGGFVGANLVRRLLQEGHQVTGVLGPGGDRWRLNGLEGSTELVDVDLRDEDAVRRLVHRVAPEWTFHLAAHGAYAWQQDARRILDTNLSATVALIDACRESGCDAFVHTGSSSEYGFKDHAPSEEELTEPNSRYALSKAAATLFCRYVAQYEDFPAVTLRLYSVFGPYEDPRRLVPAVVMHARRNELPPLVAPEVARDFVWVDDVVEALLLAAEAARHRAGGVYNVGSGVQTSMAELVRLAQRVLEVDAEPIWGSMAGRAWDASCWVADIRRVQAELGWQPRTDLAEGLRRTAAWLSARDGQWQGELVTP